MKGLVSKILYGNYAPIPDFYSDNLKVLINEMLVKDPAKRPSIKTILQKEFLSSRITDLLKKALTRNNSQNLEANFRSVPVGLQMKSAEENEMIKKPNIPTPIKKSQSLLRDDSKKTLPPKKPGSESMKIEVLNDKNKNSATKSPGPFFKDNRGYSSVVSSVAKSNGNRNSSTACETKRSPDSEYNTPTRPTENLKYSPIKNVNNVIMENLNLISQIRTT
mmetsp:Transcript_37715/g.33744  ORF Transcript_37715/g.33744 Transcript_37715/m.33744 type:complete len:220 (+) Transcript_37715:661-1320(+)|eukprot:CAMPEP_0114583458 /NCGR_PEP_ID=MMETSP0125-20121206/7176_1 /TAXON_ID=485358 ORGANISM="Aristerostoma sp., Strain ATCC 50986" /NCGR_SAMPLE_ID=MMETSP0125 /ASSEMBLY_ACC=CAM_ASM_000245 /LENGTH=219 /DNA_ID=CAMNT_0001776905 /DNA_START=636 /DNA_END=1295 /DNA_ORIENTATION=-